MLTVYVFKFFFRHNYHSYTTRTIQQSEKLSKTIFFFKFPSSFPVYEIIFGAKLVKNFHIELCEYVSLLYLDLHFDDDISWPYAEGIERF